LNKILVIQQKMIGDVLTSSILFKSLKENFPNAVLYYLINKSTFPVVENNPFIDQFLFITPEIEQSKKEFYYFSKQLKKENFDLVIDVYAKLGSAFISWFSKAKFRISYRKTYTQFLYTHTFVEKTASSLDQGLAIENRMLLLKPIIDAVVEIPKPTIYLLPKEIQHARELLLSHGIALEKPLFMISCLGSSTLKTYPLPFMAKLLDVIVQETDGQILFNYIPKQKTEVAVLFSLCTEATKQHCFIDIYGKSLRSFLSITSHCKALLGNEGGAVNMAKALEVPTFSIFSPWILKEAWNSYENSGENVSVHLQDYHRELYVEHPKRYKKQALVLYQKFTPDLIIPKLKRYLKTV